MYLRYGTRREQQGSTQRVERWFALVCCFPWFVLVVFYLEAVAALASLGHWPVPSLDDPKNLPTAPLHLLSTLFVLALLPVMVLTLLAVFRSWRVDSHSRAYWRWLALSLCGFALCAVLAHLDPGRVWSWWLD